MKTHIRRFLSRIFNKLLAVVAPSRYFAKQRRVFIQHAYHTHDIGGGSLEKLMEEAFEKFLSAEERADSKRMEWLKNDIIDSFLIYQSRPEEYFCLDFEHSSPEKRATFLTDIYKWKYVNHDLWLKELQDKVAFYRIMKPFFKREAVAVRHESDREGFVKLAMSSHRLFAKSIYGAFGWGCQVFDIESEEQANKVFDELMKGIGDESYTVPGAQEDGWIVEECIEQAEGMAKWNPDTVNTIRMPSFLINNKSHLLGIIVRTGRKGFVVDNACAGGIFACVDPATGVVTTDGMDQLGNVYVQHPDSGLAYKGAQIPEWESLLRTTEEAHRRMPQHRFIAYDFAYTKDGWVIVEGNWGQFAAQWLKKEGIKADFDRLMTAK